MAVSRKTKAVAAVAAAGAAALTYFGFDVSSYQSPSVAASAPSFSIAKATEGTGYVSPTYRADLAAAKAKKLPFAAYQFLHHGNDMAQARLAFSIVGRDVPLAVDAEWGGSPTAADIRDFVADYRALGGQVTLLYVPRSYWQQIDSPNLNLGGLQLWNANYNYASTLPSQGAYAWDSYAGLRVVILQYSDGNGHLDHDAFYGTKTQLCGFLHCWVPPVVVKPVLPVVTKPTPTPSPTATVTYYVAKPHDNILTIAAKFHITPGQLMRWNHTGYVAIGARFRVA